MKANLEFKIASEDWEFEQINQLNYKTFVEEIPQHEQNRDKSLPDKFHNENSYLICIREKRLLGMIAVRDKRPFSLDNKLNNLNSYLPDHKFACEFRLLSIEQEVRNLRIIQGLMVLLAKLADEKGYDIALISANVNRLRLYKQIGFKEFGPVVGTDEASYQPMYLTLESSREFREKSKILSRLPNNFSIHNKETVNLLPGPVTVSKEVQEAMNQLAISHRSEEFKKDFQAVKRQLCELTGVKNVEILMGSGSLANDAVAAQLSQQSGKGLILSNGEFGERLIDHAHRFDLSFESMCLPWGTVFVERDITSILDQNPEIKWIWLVHSETSTGVLNDVSALSEICADRQINLCLDCVSSLGIVAVNLNKIYMASGVSGKGLASFSGLSFIFYNQLVMPSDSIPRYLDIGFYAQSGGLPYTMSSNLLYALKESLKHFNEKNRYNELLQHSNWIRKNLDKLGFEIIAGEDCSTPGLITISLPNWISSEDLGLKLQDEGYLLHWRSEYLLKRNWIQIALMSSYSKEKIKPLFQQLCNLHKPIFKAL